MDPLCIPIYQLPISAAFILSLMLVGAWLEGINGKHGLIDELLTPLPMGLAGILMLIGRTLA